MADNIAETGDLILVTGPQEERLRVHSLILSMVSKPMRVLLGPDFKEGQTLATSGPEPAEIMLPEDDAMAMSVMCRVLHHQEDLAVSQLAPNVALKVATLADKYDCVAAVRSCLKVWVSHNHTTRNIDSLVQCMTAAYICDDALGFSAVTLSLLHDHVGPYYSILDEVSRRYLPLEMLSKYLSVFTDEIITKR